MIQFQITNIDSICDFLNEMFSRNDGEFDPADDLRILTDHNSRPLFTEEEAGYLDPIMTECFIFCVLNGVNIYTLASIVQCDLEQISHAA